MRRMALLLIPAALFGGQARFARLGELEGKVEVQLTAADPWVAAQRNLPLVESTWIRTGEASRVEIELEDGNVFRLGPDSLAEISDYSRLSTGQRVTLLSLDRGLAYFTGQPEGRDALSLAVPGAQVTLRRGARIRLEAATDWSQAAVMEGVVRFSSPAAEFDLNEGQTARVEPARTSRFFLYREVTEIELDRWSEQRDKVLVSPASGRHMPVAYGAADLDAAGEWVQTEEFGAVWKPKTQEGWAPYRNGRWQWYDALGYTWISDDPWGWAPYHHGRWARSESLGWVWAPAKNAVFKPGEVYWLRGAKIAGWGPLAPGEAWTPSAPPRQFLNVNTTWAEFQQDARVIDPAGFTARPREPLGAAAFTLALPSPAMPAARLDAARPVLRVAGTRVEPHVPGVSYQSASEAAAAQPAPPPATAAAEPPVAVVTNPGMQEPPVIVVTQPPPPPREIMYPVPVYTGIVVVNPPERDDDDHHRRRRTQPRPDTPRVQTPPSSAIRHSSETERQSPARQVAPVPTPAPAPQPPVVRSAPVRERRERPAPQAQPTTTRSEPARERQERQAPAAAEKPAEAPQPIRRGGDDAPRGRRGQ